MVYKDWRNSVPFDLLVVNKSVKVLQLCCPGISPTLSSAILLGRDLGKLTGPYQGAFPLREYATPLDIYIHICQRTLAPQTCINSVVLSSTEYTFCLQSMKNIRSEHCDMWTQNQETAV
jgi:hypothetical protein